MNILLASWNKLDPRDRRALGICLIFLFSVVLYMGVLAPLGNMYEATVQEQVELKQEIQLNTPKAMVLPDREAKLRQVKNEYESLKRQLDLVDRRDWSSSDIYNEIRDYATITGVVIKEMRPLSQKPNGFLSSQPMDVTFSGSFTAIEKFIYYLETSPQVFVVSEISLTGKSGAMQGGLVVSKYSIPAKADSKMPEHAVSLVLSMPPWIGYAPFEIARHNGWLNSNGTRIECYFSEHEKTNFEKLYAGEIDGTATHALELVQLLTRGVDLRIVAPLAQFKTGDVLMVAGNSNIKTVQDLRGKTVFLQTGGTAHYFLYEVLKQNGMSLSDVTVSDMSREIVAQSLRAGLIEAGVTFEPFVSRLQKMRIARPVAGPAEVDNWSLQFLVLREDALPGNGKAVETLISGFSRAVRWWQENPDEAVQFLSANNPQGVSQNTIKEVMKSVRFLTSEKARAYFCTEPEVDNSMDEYFRKYENFFKQELGYEVIVPKADVLDWRYARKVFNCTAHANATHGAGG
ncbi:type 4a pilus biogenesis protein PilO [Maridesulfovibrio salexigens]|uniref:ABC-type nitrate/sulfonate/bicarbonate transport systems periplasmic components-like protein n=1 Tax=Maridesulfovibrio salexigens (strain ATCC 14822 / DSM 2638 / NCIMB 8403 / VKM B-1763) TaxID=526222 RepID=C6BWY4_MARSD|nr:type 4a pilus biogenesis protein PilO [Maridesulfovibrio salexigens]ACS78464.1 ABC-type nitrate/sulfonate/bicarbonate transport systems periplasmic components-like protein [Maridesulfovibrio salexigens DSM 2638]